MAKKPDPNAIDVFILESCKGSMRIQCTYLEAKRKAREWQSEIQAQWGVTVSKAGDETILYTAK
jgi:hypothetical protein